MKTARHSDSLLLGEARKHLAFREVWVALALTLVYFAVFAKPMSDVETRWLITQSEIYRMGNIGVAFMLITTLPRLVTCEGDYGTRALIRASRHGARDTFRAKLGYAAACCLACVLLVAALTRRAALTVGLCTLLYVYGVLCNTGMIAS